MFHFAVGGPSVASWGSHWPGKLGN